LLASIVLEVLIWTTSAKFATSGVVTVRY